ncbi:hypothetical protein U3A55_12010 [Salarchaeum sp. III]|uniref:hypothetical protein n=1 Tax=Salarchaeum sp. III TaxID=3107927 RepID=UPI002ED98B45
MTDDQPQLHVGDHVHDQESDDNQLLLVTKLPTETAANHAIRDGQTVADYNPDYPGDDPVVEVCYVDRTQTKLDPSKSYAFPRSRLELVQPIHEREGDGPGGLRLDDLPDDAGEPLQEGK